LSAFRFLETSFIQREQTGDPEFLGLTESNYIAHLSAHPDGRRIALSRGPLGGAEVSVMENFLPDSR
jgi:hypothetical protein